VRGLVILGVLLGCGGSNPTTPGDDAGGDGGMPSDGSGDGDVTDAPPDLCDPGQWCTETAPGNPTLLRSVWATGLNDVFAVGDGGTILHRRDNAWTAMTSMTTLNLTGVWGASASDLWAVGEGGTVLRYDGSTWNPTGSFSVDFAAVWGSSATDVWIVGTGQVVHWNGTMFDTTSLPGTPFAISGTGPTDVWVTGENAKVDHYTGTWATGIDPGAGNTYFGILALAAGDVWITTFVPNSQTLNFNGSSWTPHVATGTSFQGLYAVSSTDIWGAGGTKVGHWDGSAWAIETPAGNAVQLLGAGGIGASLWIVGSESTILHRR